MGSEYRVRHWRAQALLAAPLQHAARREGLVDDRAGAQADRRLGPGRGGADSQPGAAKPDPARLTRPPLGACCWRTRRSSKARCSEEYFLRSYFRDAAPRGCGSRYILPQELFVGQLYVNSKTFAPGRPAVRRL